MNLSRSVLPPLVAAVTNAMVGVTLAEPTFEPLGYLAGTLLLSKAAGVSADGSVVVGSSSVSAQHRHAYRWTRDGGLLDLGTSPGLMDSDALGVSADGSTVVGISQVRAFRWNQRLGMHSLLNILNLNGSANACSIDGRIVVGYALGNTPTAFRWENSSILDLFHLAGDIDSEATDVSADGAVVVGNSVNGPNSRAFIWTAESDINPLGPFPAGAHTRATAVSADGNVVVGSVRLLGDTRVWAFRWTASSVQILDVPATRCYATDTNADGSVVIGVYDEPANEGGFIWTASTGARHIETALATGLRLNWSDFEPTGISADGRVIVGNAANQCGLIGAWRAVIDPWGGAPVSCGADFDGSGTVDPDDLADYISCFFSMPQCPRADIDGRCGIDADDLSDFITAFFTGCP